MLSCSPFQHFPSSPTGRSKQNVHFHPTFCVSEHSVSRTLRREAHPYKWEDLSSFLSKHSQGSCKKGGQLKHKMGKEQEEKPFFKGFAPPGATHFQWPLSHPSILLLIFEHQWEALSGSSTLTEKALHYLFLLVTCAFNTFTVPSVSTTECWKKGRGKPQRKAWQNTSVLE